MKSTECYIKAVTAERRTPEQRRHYKRLQDRQRKQAEYNSDKMLRAMEVTCFVLLLVAIIASVTVNHRTVQAITPAPIKTVVAMPEADIEEPDTSYRRDDIPLSYDLQDLLHATTEEYDLPYNMVLAQMWRETGYRNVMGDDGDSVGYLQVQEKWHKTRMDKLGVTDLKNPKGNFLVACDYLRECIDTTDTTADALTKYNSGHTGTNQYAIDVLTRWEQLEEK